jgi:hypothetical protein
MWLAVKALILRWVLARSFGGLVSLLLLLAVPLAGVLKVIGLPLLIVLAIVALPLLLLLAVIGLPLLLVVGTVGVVVAVAGSVLAAGLALLKIALPIILICLVGGWLWRRVRKNGDTGSAPGTSTPPTTEPGFDPGI